MNNLIRIEEVDRGAIEALDEAADLEAVDGIG